MFIYENLLTQHNVKAFMSKTLVLSICFFWLFGDLKIKKIQQQQKYYTKKSKSYNKLFCYRLLLLLFFYILFLLDFREQRLFQVHRHTNRVHQTKERATASIKQQQQY